jgi:flagellar hook assembly protein FlgD
MKHAVIIFLFFAVSIGQSYLIKDVPPLPPPTNVINVSSVQQLAVAVNSVQSGQTILLADGQYLVPPRELILRTPNVTLRGASGDASKVYLKGYGFESSTDIDEEWLKITTDGVTIADLKIGESRCHGIKFQTTCNDILIHNVHFYNIGERGIKVPRYNYHKNVEIRYCIFENDKVPDANRPGQHAGGNYIAGMDVMRADGWNIHDCVFKDIKGATGMARGGIFIWRDSRNVVIERNLFMGNDVAINFGDSITNGTIRNNFIVPGVQKGINVGSSSNGIKVYNNTSFSSLLTNPGSFAFNNCTNVEVKNNIIQAGISVLSGPHPDTAKNIIVLRAQIRNVTPWFGDENQGDLHLTSQAADAINKGMSLTGVTDDWDGDARSGTIDIGADEYDGPARVIRHTIGGALQSYLGISPNPFSTKVSIKTMQNAPFGSAQGDKLQIAKLTIYDMAGRQVREIPRSGNVRRATYIWDGRDNQGKVLPGGIYYICLKDGKQAKTVTVNLVR